jgi:arylsulfatase A-like enzyme
MGAVCSPSRAMLLTGQTLFHVNRLTSPPLPGPERPFHLWPEELRKAGYKTWATGKWHNPPALHSRCFAAGANIFMGGMNDQFKMPVHEYDASGEYPKASARVTDGKNATELFTDGALDFLTSHRGPEPFAMYVSFTSPHDPRTAPPAYHAKYVPESIPLPPGFVSGHPFDNGDLKLRDELLAGFPRTQAEIAKQQAEYYAMITHLDAQIGRILNALEASPHAKNTVVIFTSDNGLALGRHGLMGKQNVYDHSVHVPLIIAGPGIPRGQRRQRLCYSIDLFPTICEVTGVRVPASVEGRSLFGGPDRDSLFFAYRHFQRAVRTRDWKLIRYDVAGQQRTQLFHISEDPHELRDLAENSAYKPRIEDLQNVLDRWIKEVDDPHA